MTQKVRLLDYLTRFDGIDPMTAWNALGIYRLGARIHDLKKDGHNIESLRKTVTNRWGEPCEVAYYRLIRTTGQLGLNI